MHDEQEPLQDPLREPVREPLPDPLPDALRNWQVLEIDSQATPVAELAGAPGSEAGGESAAKPSSDRPEDIRDLQITDRQDEVIVAALDNHRREVACGATVEYAVSVLNNGAQTATFQMQVEGWLDPQWVGDAAPAVTIEPGRRATLRLPLAPPRRTESEAGDYHFAVTVRSPQHPGRVARLGALLTVLPFDALELRFSELPSVNVSWLRRSAALPFSVSNRGNHPAQITLHGVNERGESHFAFGVPDNDAGVASLTLQSNQAVTFPVRVEVQHPPLIGLHGRELPVQVEGRVHGQPAAGAATQLTVRPLIGPWQIVAAMGVAAAGAVGLLLVFAIIFLLAQRSAVQQTPITAAPAQAVAAPPPVIIVTLNQPASSPAAGNAPGSGPAAVSDFTTGAAPDPALPLVLPDQVSAPNGAGAEVAPAVASSASAAGAPAAALSFDGDSTASGAPPGQTYGQMFQAVGSQFDLDWRMLAAQAYVESGFDSLALSDAGAMGLMQVLPDTWREWAPAVEVSDPFDAHSSVLVAAAYLDYLRSRLAAAGYPETEWMLVAYNWGPEQLNGFLTDGGNWDTLPEMRRQYAGEILRIAKSIP